MISKVNLLQGTDSVHDLSKGNTLPIVARPWGMHHWSLQTGATPWVFNCRHTRVRGFRLTHQPSPWMQDYACLTVLPFTGVDCGGGEQQASSYFVERSVLEPSYMQVDLLRYGVQMEMSPTERGAIMAFDFPADSAPRVGFYFDGEHRVRMDGDSRVAGCSRYSKDPIPDAYGLFFKGLCSVQPSGFKETEWGGYLEFSKGVRRVELRLCASFIDEAQAALDLKRELEGKGLETVREEGAQVWNQLLGRFEIEAETEAQERIFYSCLYRCLLFPRFLDEIDSEGLICHRSPYDGELYEGSLCTDSGFWDVYRTLYPFLALAYPEVLKRMIGGWMNACRESGWAPKWPSPGPRDCMIGTHFDVFVADVIAKGFTDWDVEEAFSYLWKNATVESSDGCFGRDGLDAYDALGYVPADLFSKATACTLDYAYNDFCIGQVARYLGEHEKAERLLERARNYRNVFDPEVGMMRGRNADGSWLSPFRPFEWGSSFIEGGTWQHSFNVPHDPDGLAEIFGGADALCAKLDEMLNQEPRFEAGSYGFEIHEASEMAMADFGQYAHSNQPVHGFLFLYALMGQSAKTDYWVHRVCNELYTVNDFPGDEDNGEMSAWYIWACLGLFPYCPGTDEYLNFKPFIKRVRLHLPNEPKPLEFGQEAFLGALRVRHQDLVEALQAEEVF